MLDLKEVATKWIQPLKTVLDVRSRFWSLTRHKAFRVLNLRTGYWFVDGKVVWGEEAKNLGLTVKDEGNKRPADAGGATAKRYVVFIL